MKRILQIPNICMWIKHSLTESRACFHLVIFTVRNSSYGKIMFLRLSVILFTGGGITSESKGWGCLPLGTGGVCLLSTGGCTSPRQAPPRQTPPGRYPSPRQIPPKADTPQANTPRRPPQRPLQRTVHILLECILVILLLFLSSSLILSLAGDLSKCVWFIT